MIAIGMKVKYEIMFEHIGYVQKKAKFIKDIQTQYWVVSDTHHGGTYEMAEHDLQPIEDYEARFHGGAK